MTARTRIPRLCARVTAELARELRKPWPPTKLKLIVTTPRHADEHQHYRQTGEKAA